MTRAKTMPQDRSKVSHRSGSACVFLQPLPALTPLSRAAQEQARVVGADQHVLRESRVQVDATRAGTVAQTAVAPGPQRAGLRERVDRAAELVRRAEQSVPQRRVTHRQVVADAARALQCHAVHVERRLSRAVAQSRVQIVDALQGPRRASPRSRCRASDRLCDL